jgi:predicted SAM-dependent methyltransferase
MIHLPKGPHLNIGCGPYNPAGWINIDGSWQARLAGRTALAWLARRFTGRQVGQWPYGIIHRNIRRGLGYEPATVAVVYSSHTLEHLYRDEAVAFMREVYRILMPGGICRVVVPDVAAIIEWYLQHHAQSPESKKQASSDLLMEMLSLRSTHAPQHRGLLAWYRLSTDFDDHKWMYDAEGLVALFSEVGFSNSQPYGYLESAIPQSDLSAVEREDRLQNGAGICVEARK